MLVARIVSYKYVIFFLAVLSFFFTFLTPLVQAQESTESSCVCYCTSTTGARPFSTDSTISGCHDLCEAEPGSRYLGCWTVAQKDLWPDKNKMCWTKSECTADMVQIPVNATETVEKASIWGGQSAECPPGKGFCYNPSVPVTLNVAIGKLKQAGTIGEYISGLYTWLLYATALLAVIMIMIGGVQYAMAAGKQGAIGQAKKRIVDAVIGLILVFCAALIGALIDPNLVTFRQIGVPKIKTVTFIPDDASCDYLDEKGFTVSATEGQECGKPGRVTELSTDPTVGDTTIELNHECTWMGCEEDFEACVAIADGDEDFGCVRCADSWDYYEGGTYEKGVTPVPSNCERLTPDDDVIDGNEKNGDYGYCEYTAGFSLLGVDFGRACVEFYYPPSKAEVVGGGDIGVDCEVLRQDARNAGSESCRAYDNVFVRYANRLQYEFTSVDNFQDQKGEYLVKRICEDDPCGFGQETAQAANKSVNCKYFDPFTATPGFYDTICTVPGLGHLPGCLWLQESTAPVGCYDSEYVSNYMADYATLSTIFSGESEDSYAEQISEAASILSTNPVCLDVNGNQTYAICKSTW